MAYPELTDKQRNYPYSGNVQNPLVVPETRGTVLPTGATPEQTAQGKQNWQSNAPQQYANNPVGTVQYNIFKAMEQQKAQPVTQPQVNGTGTAAGTTNSRTSSGNGATETGGTRPIRSMDDLVSAMYTDPQQEEKLRKASVANQRIMAVGDALRHIGNIFNTVNYAPSQQFNKPWEEERNRYLQEKAYRDKRNQIYMTYQQQKAAQDAKMRQAEAQNQLRSELNAAQVQNYKDRAAEYIRHNKEMEDLYKSKAETAAQNAQRNYEHKVETDKRRLDISQQRANRTGTGRSRSSNGGGSRTGGYTQTTTYTYDKNGKRTGSVVKKTPEGTYDQQKGKGYGKDSGKGKGRGY
jgi:hypothetical protein